MFSPIFANRYEAGHTLGEKLKALNLRNPVVLALPRGGVPVGYEVARVLHAPLDVLLVRKIGAPLQPELALGAVLDGADPQVVVNEKVVRSFEGIDSYLNEETQRQLEEIARRRVLYRGGRPALPVRGRDAIVIDDGIATGATIRAALQGLRRAKPSKLIVAVPVAPADTVRELRSLADDVVCIATPDPFIAVGVFYADFSQTTDKEVIDLLKREDESRPPRDPDAPSPLHQA